MEDLSKLSDEELILKFKALWHAIHITEIYYIGEKEELKRVEEELGKRGYAIVIGSPEVIKGKRL